MVTFDLANYPGEIVALWRLARLPELGPGTPNEAARMLLAELTPNSFPNVKDLDAAKACISGLWLYHDFLDESHTISQDLEDWYGSYWHAIMHRREPDAENAKYWCRKISPNPLQQTLVEQAPALGLKYISPATFVDFCESIRGTGTRVEEVAKQVQLLEMQLLFAWCYQRAVG